MKFLRRKDITISDRAVIGLKAIIGAGVYGAVHGCSPYKE